MLFNFILSLFKKKRKNTIQTAIDLRKWYYINYALPQGTINDMTENRSNKDIATALIYCEPEIQKRYFESGFIKGKDNIKEIQTLIKTLKVNKIQSDRMKADISNNGITQIWNKGISKHDDTALITWCRFHPELPYFV